MPDALHIQTGHAQYGAEPRPNYGVSRFGQGLPNRVKSLAGERSVEPPERRP